MSIETATTLPHEDSLKFLQLIGIHPERLDYDIYTDAFDYSEADKTLTINPKNPIQQRELEGFTLEEHRRMPNGKFVVAYELEYHTIDLYDTINKVAYLCGSDNYVDGNLAPVIQFDLDGGEVSVDDLLRTTELPESGMALAADLFTDRLLADLQLDGSEEVYITDVYSKAFYIPQPDHQYLSITFDDNELYGTKHQAQAIPFTELVKLAA